MTVVEAWQLWPFWRLLVWAAVGATLLAFAIPSPTAVQPVPLPSLPPPTFRPPNVPTVQPQPPAAAAAVASSRPKTVPSIPLERAEGAVAAPAARPLIVPGDVPAPVPKRDPATFAGDPRTLKPRPLVQP